MGQDSLPEPPRSSSRSEALGFGLHLSALATGLAAVAIASGPLASSSGLLVAATGVVLGWRVFAARSNARVRSRAA